MSVPFSAGVVWGNRFKRVCKALIIKINKTRALILVLKKLKIYDFF